MDKLKRLEFTDEENGRLMDMFPDPQYHPILFSAPYLVLRKLLELEAKIVLDRFKI